MARGRCSGCGTEDPSAKKVERHVSSCPDYLALWKSNPERCLSPEAEMARHAEHASSEEYLEAKAAAKDERYAGYRADNERRVEAQASRWKSKAFKSGNATSAPAAPPTHLGARLEPTRFVVPAGVSSDPARRVAAKATEIRVGYDSSESEA